MCRSVFNFYRGSGYWSTTPNPHLVGDNSVLERVDFRSRRLEVCRGAAWVYEAEALQPIPCRLHLQHSIAFRWFREKAFNRWGRGAMSYNYPPPPGGGMRGPPSNSGYGQPAPPNGPPGSGSAGLGSQPPPQQPPPQQQTQYGGYGPPSGTRSPPPPAAAAQYGGPPPGYGAPPAAAGYHPPPPQHQPPGSFGRPPSDGVRGGIGGAPPPPISAPPMGGGRQPLLAANGGGSVPPPPPGGPASTGRGPQFVSVEGQGGVGPPPTSSQAGPPMSGPSPARMNMPPPPTGQDLARQLGQVSLGPPQPNGMAPPMRAPPSGYPNAPPGPPGMQQQQQQPPPQQQQGRYGGSGAGYPPQQQATGGAPMGAATSASIANQPVLPSLHETDMTIQADPRVMRMTVGAVPNSSSAHGQSKLPLGLVIQAMALDIDQKDGGLEVVNFGAMGIMRCKRCRTYINPYVSWLGNGRQWRCNVCGMVNDVPTAYFCHLDQDGHRTDKADRPELSQASVELVAPAEYMVRPPQPPVYMFVVDVSAPAVTSGMVHVAAETIRACLNDLPGGERTMVGVCTFDSGVHYYNLKSTLSQPQMLVVPDLSDPFLPVPEDLLVNLSESRAVVETLLDSLAQMHAGTRDAECCLGAALTAAGKVMGHVGGKMVVLCASLPSTGEARLKHRENPRALGTDREHMLLKAEDPWYQNKAVEFSKLQICVDLFLFSGQYTDVATLANLPKFTAGQLFYYPGFTAQVEGDRFNVDLSRVLTRATAFEAVMRVRATRGLRITNFYGNYFIRGTDLLALPNCTPDSVFAVEFGYDEQLLTSSVVSVQAALLYTTSCGERRIRVHNLAIPVETVIQNVFDSVNIDVLCNILAKQALEVALKSGLDTARGRIQQACVDMVRASRGGGYGSSPYMAPGGQQQQQGTAISNAIQLLPLYSMALQKNVAFRGGTDVRSDERANVMSQLASMPVDHSRCFTYPRMFTLHEMDEDAGLQLSNIASSDEDVPTAGNDAIKLPPVANLSAERLSTDGVFLLENGIDLYLWVGRGADPDLVSALFGVASLEGQDLNLIQIQAEGNDLCRRVNNMISALREERMTYLKVTVVGEGDGQNERRFYWHLVEDRASFPGGSMNYAEYMQNINRHSVGGMGMGMG